MDELAWELNIDSVELRLRNETKEHQRKKLPFSAKHFVACLQTGARQFGWSERVMKPRSQQKGGRLVGWGMASASFPALRAGGTAKVCLFPNETAQV